MPEMKFEQALAKLEKIIEALDSGELDLDAAIKKYEEGLKLSKFCNKRLETIEKKIQMVKAKPDGDTEVVDLEEK